MQRENLIRKIQALLARADKDRNDNEHEREIALRQANAMMAKHNLSIVELSEAEQREELGELTEGQKSLTGAIWQAVVYSAVAKLNGCKCLRNTSKKIVMVIGHSSRVDISVAMAEYVIASIKREMPRAFDNHLGIGEVINRRSFNTSFGNGAASAVFANVKTILAARRRGQIDGENLSRHQAMVLVDQDKKQMADVLSFYHRQHPHVRRGSGSNSRSYQGYQAGKSYGSGISLNTQIGGRSAGLLN